MSAAETLDFARTLSAFPFALRRFLAGAPLTVEAARQLVRERMARREANFLHLVEHAIYGWAHSPYRPLLRQAGCALGDIQTLVKRDGVEGALTRLRDSGVYVTFEEFKGRRPIRRGTLEFAANPRDFDNPLSRRDLLFDTGGSTGAALSVGIDLGHIAARAPHRLLTLATHGVADAPTAIWQGMLPHPGLRVMLWGARTGRMPEKWFSPVGWRESRQWLKYALATQYLLACLRLAGVAVPAPEHVPVDRAGAIVRWVERTLKTHGQGVVRAGVSRSLRLCLEAQAAGVELTGLTLTGGGEPPTPAKVSRMSAAGARFISNYGMTEAGQAGSGCARPVDASDVHLFKDMLALITHPYPVPGADVTVPAFNVTSLLATASKVMLNVQVDDYGIVEERQCGCELETCGYTTHLREIRSYGKLTGEGVTLVGSEMLRVLEETLPAKFGGTALDYQMQEEENEHGLTRLFLVIDPQIKIADEQAAIDAVLTGLGRSSPMADAARVVWQNAGTIRVKRAKPIWTERGKLLPLHILRRKQE